MITNVPTQLCKKIWCTSHHYSALNDLHQIASAAKSSTKGSKIKFFITVNMKNQILSTCESNINYDDIYINHV